MDHPTPPATTAIRVDSGLAPHTAEAMAAGVRSALKSGTTAFHFTLEPGFLPTIGWLDRFRSVLEPVVRERRPVEVACSRTQSETLWLAGIHLLADITVAAG